ncbi:MULTISPECIES: Uma2 family endonuclease [Cyanophyceae]|uniref:Uma2 family endonuclease n=1 Tax=Leptolyngbya subtilissima DQ-A4 TaxID=2933933 RepID=A0ABV0K138_9CYAN|nr:Uma2 family endonuclease [Nodosilinea sp. FACHB-141]MBD2111271.1 Uma2 family endonuclease [Nodosilinea sp. FACHB-141]
MTAVLVPPQRQVVLQGVSWATYQSLSRDLEAAPSKRLTYDQGALEIMVPLPPYESYKKLMGRMVEVTTEETETEIRSLGSTTWSREDLSKGLEPDQCYYIQHEQAVRGKDEIDLTVDPPPDLAIEIDHTSSFLDRIAIYAALGVPEVWRFDGATLTIFALINGRYCSQAASTVLPLLRQDTLLRFLQTSQTMGETSWVKAFRQWIREQHRKIN